MNPGSVLSRSKIAYGVVAADLIRDAAAITGVWSRNFPQLTTDQHRMRFEWNYCAGPYGPGRCWLLLAGDTVVGTAGVGLRRLRAAGKTYMAGLASDLAVDTQHRSLQPALMLQKKVLSVLPENEVSLVYGLPNPKSMGVFRRLGYSPVTTIRRFVKVLRIEHYLEQQNTLPALAQKILAAPANLGIKMAWPDGWHKSNDWVIREMPAFDERFDGLAERTQSAAELTSDRSASYLQWRYTGYPLQSYVTIGLLTPDESRLAGYAVMYTGAHDQMMLVDFWHEPGQQVGNDLMAGVISWSRRQGAASIAMETSGGAEVDRVLRRFGFSLRQESMELMAMQAPNSGSELNALLDTWYFAGGDEDYN